MPNWIYNDVTISGTPKAISAIKRKLDGEVSFDFEQLIPMPEGLNIQRDDATNLGMACFDQQRFADMTRRPEFQLEYPGVTTPAQLRKFVEAQSPEIVALGEHAQDNIEKYGVPTWYEWRIKYWGTKWNAGNVEVVTEEPTTLSYRFNTAWTAAHPVAVALRHLCDELGLTLSWDAHDEGEPGAWLSL